ncbi:MAG: hypothetical protein Q9159_005310 [Coniocarpon cinnabarinum]
MDDSNTYPGNTVTVIKITDLNAERESETNPSPHIKDCEYVGSYCWTGSNEPRIVVPGSPPMWAPPEITPRLDQDSGPYYRDINAAKYIRHPMEPAVRSVVEVGVANFNGVDVFGCGNTLGNLLKFVRQEAKPFKFNVEMFANTALLIRQEDPPHATIPNVFGYGHTMPEAYTKWHPDVKGSLSYQRVVKYTFAGLKCVVRFEADGYLPDGSQDVEEESKEESQDTMELEDGEKSVSRAPENDVPGSNSGVGGGLAIKRGGVIVPQAAIFDLKTRSIRKKGQDFLSDQLPRLWLTQVPNLVLAFHDWGKFNDINVIKAEEEVSHWESTNGPILSTFAALLKKITDAAWQSVGGLLEVEYQGEAEQLNIREIGGGVNVLPKELRVRWIEGSPSTL